MEKDVRRIEIFLVLAVIGTFFFLGSNIITGLYSYVTNYTEPYDLRISNYSRDVFVYDTGLDDRDLSAVDGQVGDYYKFDGTLDRIATLVSTSTIQQYNYTVSFWFRRADSVAPRGVVVLGNSTHDMRFFVDGSGSLEWDIFPGELGNLASSPIAVNEWNHIAVSWNGVTGRYYINGTNIANTTTNMSMPLIRSLNMSFTAGSLFNGSIDEFAVYNETLTDSQITDIYTRGSSGLTNNVTFGSKLYLNGNGYVNQHNQSPFSPHGFAIDDAYYTTSYWMNQSGASWWLEGNTSIAGRYITRELAANGIVVNNSASNQTFNLSAGGSLVAWVYRIPSSTWIAGNVFHQYNGSIGGSGDFSMAVSPSSGNIFCSFKTVNGSESGAGISSTSNLSYYRWHHVVCTNNAGSRKIFLDGSDVSGTTSSFTASGLAGYPMRIGTGYLASNFYSWNGHLDETAIYNRALTSSEVSSLYNRGVAHLDNNITSGLELYYPFDDWCFRENTVDCFKDHSGFNRHGESCTVGCSQTQFSVVSRSSQADFPGIATCIVSHQGVSIFNESGDFWGGFRATDNDLPLGLTPTSCSASNGLVCVGTTSTGVRCLDFASDKTFRWLNGASATGFEIDRANPVVSTWTASSQVGVLSSTTNQISMMNIGNDTYILKCGGSGVSIINFTGHTTWDDSVSSTSKCHLKNNILVYNDGNSLALRSGLPTADFTPSFTTTFSNLQAIASNDTRIYVGNSTDLFSYNLTLQDAVNHTNLLNGVNNVTDLEVLADRWLWVSTAPEGNISEINLSSNTTRTSLFDIFPSRNFTALSVYVNDSDSSNLGAYDGCESSGLVAVGFNESGASLLNWTGLYCTNESPTIDQVVLTSNSTYNLTTGNLSVSFVNVSDREGDAVMNITDWRVNDTSIAVVYLPFEGGSNSTFTKDYTTYKNNGSVSGAVFNNFGGFDSFGAYEFDGTAKTISVPFSADLSDEYTISFRVNTTNNETGQIQGVVSISNSSHALRMFINPSSMEFDISPGEIGNLATPIERNEWKFYAAVWDGSSSYLYEDGTLVATSSANMSFPGASSIALSWPVNEYLNGTLDDFRVFNRSLSYDQIVRIYSNQTNVTVHNETMKGEVWSACVTPNDRVQDGDEVCSNDLTILNSAPTIDEVQLNSSEGDNLTDEDLFLTLINVSDDDGDEVKNISDWQLYNGTGFESIALVNLPFEGGSNSTITRDYSTFQRNGTVSSAVFNATGGFDGFGAYMFNGASRTISVPFSANMSQQYTISFWVNTTNNETGQRQGVISLGNSSHSLRLFINPSNLEFDIFPGEIGNLVSSVERNEWRFYAAVWDGSSSYLYEDGALVTISSANMSFPGATSLTLSWLVDEYLNGSLDEVRVFNRSLSADQIELLYNNDILTLSSYETEAQQIWQGCVTPNDHTNDGPTVCSNNLTVDTVTLDIAFLKGTLDCTMAIYQDFDEATFYTCGDIASVNGVIECDLDDDGNSSLTIPTTSSSCDIGNPNYGAIVVYNNGTNVSLNVSLLNLTVGGIENAVMQIDTYIFNAVSAPGCNGASCNNCPSADTTGCFLDLNSTTSEPNSTIECDHFKRDSAVCECFSIHVEDADTVHELKNGSQVSFIVKKTAVPDPPEVCS